MLLQVVVFYDQTYLVDSLFFSFSCSQHLRDKNPRERFLLLLHLALQSVSRSVKGWVVVMPDSEASVVLDLS